MALKTRDEVFLGIVVQPKTKRPLYVVRAEGMSKTVQVFETGELSGDEVTFARMGEGYLDEGGSEYAASATVSGFPRAHTPGGVAVRGGGYGTTLYTGLVLLASAEADGTLDLGSWSTASGHGISSMTENRSSSADAWWSAASERGLVTQVEGEGGEEEQTEEEENVDLESHLSGRAWRKVEEAIRDAIVDYGDGEFPTNIRVTVDLERTITTPQDVTADVYTFDSAWSHGLIALTDLPRVGGEDAIMTWAAEEDIDEVRAAKEVLIALNLAHEPRAIVEKLIRVAGKVGATEQELADMRLRNNLGVTLPEDKPAEVVEEGVKVEALRAPRGVGARARLTPAATRALDRLAEHRAELPWGEIEDLP